MVRIYQSIIWYVYTTTGTGLPTDYYPSNGQQIGAGSVGGSGRGSSGALVPQQPAAPAAPNALPHQPQQPHLHPTIPGNKNKHLFTSILISFFVICPCGKYI